MIREWIGFFLLVIFDIANIFSIRKVLDEFLMGNCSKRNYKAIKRTERPLKDDITLSYIKQYIREEDEKKSFDRYHTYFMIALYSIPIRFVISFILILTNVISFRTVFIVYGVTQLLHAYVRWHEVNPFVPVTKMTYHSGKYYKHAEKIYEKDRKKGKKL